MCVRKSSHSKNRYACASTNFDVTSQLPLWPKTSKVPITFYIMAHDMDIHLNKLTKHAKKTGKVGHLIAMAIAPKGGVAFTLGLSTAKKTNSSKSGTLRMHR